MKHFFMITLCCSGLFLAAQTRIERQVIGISGTSIKAESFSLDWTLGEVAVATHNAPFGSLTEGFQQAFVKIETPFISTKNVTDVLIMPNPASSFVVVKFLQEPKVSMYWELFDITGKSMQQNTFDLSSYHEIDVSNYPDGIYVLKISGENSIQTHRITKSKF